MAQPLFKNYKTQATAASAPRIPFNEGVPVRCIAEVIGQHLNLPVVSKPVAEATDHFGWLGAFLQVDAPASSALTQ